MDWPKARATLLVAFTLVNLLLAYSIWGPTGILAGLAGTPHRQQVQQVKAKLNERGLDLAAVVPETPDRMRFLRVEYKPTLEFPQGPVEPYGKALLPGSLPSRPIPQGLNRSFDPILDEATQAVVYRPVGRPLREIRLDNRSQMIQDVRDLLESENLLPSDARISGVFPKGETGHYVVEFVPVFDDHFVFSGFIRAEVSPQGLEGVTKLWVKPQQYKDSPAKAVRPAAEALLRLAGHLERTGSKRQVITDIQLGYYAGRQLTALQAGVINGWDTVPVWRIALDSGQIYYMNAFNGEFES